MCVEQCEVIIGKLLQEIFAEWRQKSVNSLLKTECGIQKKETEGTEEEGNADKDPQIFDK